MESDTEGHASGMEHALTRQARKELSKVDAWLADIARRKDELSARMKAGGKWEAVWEPTHDVVREGGVIRPQANMAAVVVTPAVRDRALALLNTVIAQCADRGLSVWLAGGKTLIGRAEYSFVLRMSELAEKKANAPEIRFAPPGWAPTGRLRITLRDGPRSDIRIRDEAAKLVEDQVGYLVNYVAKAIADAPERERRDAEARAAYRSQVAAEEEARKESDRVAGEIRARQERELARQMDLRREAGAWREAADIRAYVLAVQRAAEGSARQGSADEWAAWANGMADVLDPISFRLERGLGDEVPERGADEQLMSRRS